MHVWVQAKGNLLRNRKIVYGDVGNENCDVDPNLFWGLTRPEAKGHWRMERDRVNKFLRA